VSLVAVNGQRIIGLSKSELIKLWMKRATRLTPIKLTIQGPDEQASVFRTVELIRIPPSKKTAK